jgi:hypothetical protein
MAVARSDLFVVPVDDELLELLAEQTPWIVSPMLLVDATSYAGFSGGGGFLPQGRQELPARFSCGALGRIIAGN